MLVPGCFTFDWKESSKDSFLVKTALITAHLNDGIVKARLDVFKTGRCYLAIYTTNGVVQFDLDNEDQGVLIIRCLTTVV